MCEDQDICFSIRETKNMIFRFIHRKVTDSGYGDLSPVQYGIIRYLNDHVDHPVYQKDLETAFNIRRSTIAGILQGLEKKGYIQRIPVPADRRVKQIVCMEKAKEMNHHMRQMMQENEIVFFRGISSEEQKELIRILKKIRDNIKEEESRNG